VLKVIFPFILTTVGLAQFKKRYLCLGEARKKWARDLIPVSEAVLGPSLTLAGTYTAARSEPRQKWRMPGTMLGTLQNPNQARV